MRGAGRSGHTSSGPAAARRAGWTPWVAEALARAGAGGAEARRRVPGQRRPRGRARGARLRHRRDRLGAARTRSSTTPSRCFAPAWTSPAGWRSSAAPGSTAPACCPDGTHRPLRGRRPHLRRLGRRRSPWQEAMWWAARAEDGRGPDTALRTALPHHFGLDSMADLIEAVHLGTLVRGALHGAHPRAVRGRRGRRRRWRPTSCDGRPTRWSRWPRPRSAGSGSRGADRRRARRRRPDRRPPRPHGRDRAPARGGGAVRRRPGGRGPADRGRRPPGPGPHRRERRRLAQRLRETWGDTQVHVVG